MNRHVSRLARGPRRLARRMPLHTRLAIMATAAVALAVAVVAAARHG